MENASKKENENGPKELSVGVENVESEAIKSEAIKSEAIKEAIKIETERNVMKIRCAKCQSEESLNEEDVKLLAHVVKKYKKASPVDYLEVLSVIKGKCSDNERHVFVFDESFDKTVAGTIKEYNDALVTNVARKKTLEEVGILIHETANQIKSLQSTLVDLEKKKELILAEMANGGELIENIELKFMKLTGTDDMNIWS